MLFVTIIVTLLMEPVFPFRGPHHPRSSVLHNHYVPEPSVKITQNEELLQDATHLAEDMGSMAEHIDIVNMNAQELEFYYFKFHDIDNNTKLDGLELLRALQHSLHGEENDENSNEVDHVHADQEHAVVDDSWIIELIDRVLAEDDLDNDGYLGYIEYVLGRQKDQDEKERRKIKLKI
ncbi:multiple coagulation factor deficiency protein 2 homolog [Venturia canescens]|uniref:multiple coagulation factor deficiency protein 2 homolog n=1 Tax=Venturia canescens TaxID=32260 RepID=UPI001C9CC207|nr:multiple coagulation factor deficiency protein 2 homolog [Venturia canescens]